MGYGGAARVEDGVAVARGGVTPAKWECTEGLA